MTNKKEFLMTTDGFLKLEAELEDLKVNKRPEIIKALKDARALGDLSENADYDAARNDQSQLETRIKELDFMLSNAKIIEESTSEVINVGSTVTISYVDDNDEEVYKIVGSLEADPFNNKISNESPIGVAIMGKKVNDIISVESPTGSYDIRIKKIA